MAKARRGKSVVGDLVNFRGLVYAPINETGVVFLFGKVAADLNMYVEEIKTGFPDCIARRFTGKGWERVAVEFEFRSSGFLQHKHDPNTATLDFRRARRRTCAARTYIKWRRGVVPGAGPSWKAVFMPGSRIGGRMLRAYCEI